MKACGRYFLDFCFIGLFFSITGFLIYQIAIPSNILPVPESSVRVALLVLLVVTISVIAILVFKQRYFSHLKAEMEELNGLLNNASLEEVVKAADTHDYDQLKKTGGSFWVFLERENKLRMDLQQKYNQLLYSYMSLEEKYAQSYTVQLILEEISRELDSDRLLQKTTDIIMGVFGSKKCIIYMTDEERNLLTVKASSEFTDSTSDKEAISLSSNSIIARAWRNRRVYTEADARPKEMEGLKRCNINSILVIPLTGRRGCLGVLVVEHELANGLSTDLIEFAKLIAKELSLSVENADLYGRMRRMASNDALTGVYNRMYLINYIVEVFDKKPNTVSLIMFDMDFFKRINDRYGHLVGDSVLKTTTALIQNILPTGILARYGGEEFVIVLPGVNSGDAYEFAEIVRQVIADHEFNAADGSRIAVTLSAGLANYPSVAGGYEELLQKADEALYEAKKAGRNKVLSFQRRCRNC